MADKRKSYGVILEARVDPKQLQENINKIKTKIDVETNIPYKEVKEIQEGLYRTRIETKKLNEETKELEVTERVIVEDVKKQREETAKRAELTKKIREFGGAAAEKATLTELKAQTKELQQQVSLSKQIGRATDIKPLGAGYTSADVQSAIRAAAGAKNSTIAAAGSRWAGTEQFDRYIQSVRIGSNEWQNYEYNVNKATGAVTSMDKGVTNMNKALALQGDTLGKITVKFLKWVVLGNMIYTPIRLMKQALETMKEVDKELTEIGKVTDQRIADLKELRNAAYEAANAFGATAKGYLEAYTAMSRAGYRAAAKGLSEVSLAAQVAGDLTADLANDWILATDAAFHYGGSQAKLMEALDLSNQLTNRNAVELKDLTLAFKVAGSQAAQMGLSIEEINAATGTMVAVTRQGGNIAGLALKGILMNIQQVKGTIDEETGEIVDTKSISKANEAIEAAKVATMEYREGILELRDPIKVLGELASKWGDLGSVQQSQLTEALGGKYRGNQFVALMENWSLYEKMLNDQVDATGSAAEEIAIYLESWEGRINKLNNAWANFVQKTLDAEWVKALISGATTLIDVMNNLGSALGLVSGLLVTLKSNTIGTMAMNTWTNIKNIGESMASVVGPASSAAKGIDAVGDAAKNAEKKVAGITGTIGLAITAISLISMAVAHYREENESLNVSLDVVTKSHKELKKEVAATNKVFNESKSETEAQAKAAENYAKKLNELANKTNLTAYEQAQMKLAVGELNKIIPDLNLSIDATTGKLNMQYGELLKNIDGFKKLGLAQAYQSLIGEKNKQIAESQLRLSKLNAESAELGGYKEDSGSIKGLLNAIPNAIHNTKVTNLQGQIRKESLLISGLNADVDKALAEVEKYSQEFDKLLSGSSSSQAFSGDVLGGGGSSSGGKTKEDVLAVFNEIKRIFNHRIFVSEQLQSKYGEETDEYKKQTELQTKYYIAMQEAAHKWADDLRKRGFAEESEEIAELQRVWWEAEQWKLKKKEEALEKQRKLDEEYRKDLKDSVQKEYDAGRKRIDDQLKAEQEAHESKMKRHDTEISKLNSIIALEEAHYDLLKSVTGAQRDIDTQLRIAKESYEYLDEQTRKMLFNEKDYAVLSKKLSGITAEAKSIYEQYQNRINRLTSDNIYLAETLTNEFERQYEVKMKEYEIAKAELGLAKAKTALENAQVNRNTMMLINGQFQWVADPEAVKDALEGLAEAEQDHADAIADISHTRKVNELKASRDAIDVQKAKLDMEYDAVKKRLTTELETMEEAWRKIQESIEEPAKDFSAVLEDIAKNSTPELKQVILSVASALSALTGVGASQIGSIVGGGNSSGGKTVKVGADGKAPAGTKVGDTVLTSGGTYQVVERGTPGSTYNPSSGLSSIKVDNKATYDKGGIARGIGFLFKNTSKDEAVLPPDVTKPMLDPMRSRQFTAMTKDMVALSEVASKFAGNGMEKIVMGNMSKDITGNHKTSTVDSHDRIVYLDGIKLEGQKAINLQNALWDILPINNNKWNK